MSGVYRCVASNAAGTDQLDHHFYVSGDLRQNRCFIGHERLLKIPIFPANLE